MPLNDVYAVAASTSEIKLIQLVTGSTGNCTGKGPLAGSTMLSKSTTLCEHRREAISVAFDSDLCISIAQDNQVVVYKITGGTNMQFRQTKVLLKKEFPADESPISENSCIAIKKTNNTKNEEVYFAISNDKGGFTVWHLKLDAKGETV